MDRYTISYNIDDYGVLRIYRGNYLIASLTECESMNQEEVIELIEEILMEQKDG